MGYSISTMRYTSHCVTAVCNAMKLKQTLICRKKKKKKKKKQRTIHTAENVTVQLWHAEPGYAHYAEKAGFFGGKGS